MVLEIEIKGVHSKSVGGIAARTPVKIHLQ
jgi:hypothetical protein